MQSPQAAGSKRRQTPQLTWCWDGQQWDSKLGKVGYTTKSKSAVGRIGENHTLRFFSVPESHTLPVIRSDILDIQKWKAASEVLHLSL